MSLDISKLKSLNVSNARPKLTASDGAINDTFGRSLAFSNNGLLAVGAIGDGPHYTGAVYLFSGSGTNWTQIKKITASDADTNDHFGTSVAFSKDGNVLAIGSPGDDDNNKSSSGSVYLYDLPLKKQKKQKSTIQLDNSQVDEYVEGDKYNTRTILGIVKTTNANGDEVNYLILDDNNPYYEILKAKNDKKTLESYQETYRYSAEIYNYIVSLLKNL